MYFGGESEHHHQELLQELDGNFKELSKTSNDPREGWKGVSISGRLKCIGIQGNCHSWVKSYFDQEPG